MSPSSSLAARLLRHTSSASSPASILRRCIHHTSPCRPPVPLPRHFASSPSPPEVSSFLPRRFLASSSSAASKVSADDNLKRVIDSEIDCVAQSQDPSSVQQIDLPEDFPFEIIDSPGDQSITLKREFVGETIKATIYTNFDEEDLNEDDNDANDDNGEDSFKPAIQMVVTIEKREGPILEFCCNFNDDELEIESMRLQNRDNPDAENVFEGPGFSILDESLQKSLHKYLEARGIKHSLYDLLYEYMMDKDEREYVVWLKNMKEFIGK